MKLLLFEKIIIIKKATYFIFSLKSLQHYSGESVMLWTILKSESYHSSEHIKMWNTLTPCLAKGTY